MAGDGTTKNWPYKRYGLTSDVTMLLYYYGAPPVEDWAILFLEWRTFLDRMGGMDGTPFKMNGTQVSTSNQLCL